MKRTLVPGNEKRRAVRGKTKRGRGEGGFVLIDALLCLFLSGIIIGVAANSHDTRRRVLEKLTELTGQLIGERNRIDGERTGINEKQ
jgi:hypothetical protein